jgi:hypothetical protein
MHKALTRHKRLRNLLSSLQLDTEAPYVPLAIAGIRIDLHTGSSALYARLREFFHNYLGTGKAPHKLSIEIISEPGLWDDEDPEFIIEANSVLHRDFAAKLIHSEDGSISAAAIAAPDLDDAMHNLLRWFLPKLLIGTNSFLVHGAGLCRDGQGYAFFGKSGAGKSTTVNTIAATDTSATVIGDDSIIVRLSSNETVQLLSAPLGAGYTRIAPPNLTIPLRGLYMIEKATENRVERLSETEGTAALLANAMCVSFDESIQERLNLASRIARSKTGVSRLQLTRGIGFWEPLLTREQRDG